MLCLFYIRNGVANRIGTLAQAERIKRPLAEVKMNTPTPFLLRVSKQHMTNVKTVHVLGAQLSLRVSQFMMVCV